LNSNSFEKKEKIKTGTYTRSINSINKRYYLLLGLESDMVLPYWACLPTFNGSKLSMDMIIIS